jgi:hypothetical protein
VRGARIGNKASGRYAAQEIRTARSREGNGAGGAPDICVRYHTDCPARLCRRRRGLDHDQRSAVNCVLDGALACREWRESEKRHHSHLVDSGLAFFRTFLAFDYVTTYVPHTICTSRRAGQHILLGAHCRCLMLSPISFRQRARLPRQIDVPQRVKLHV